MEGIQKRVRGLVRDRGMRGEVGRGHVKRGDTEA